MVVSIITATYNSASHIGGCIESVNRQDYPHIEQIIVDGASKDKTLEIIDSAAARVSTVISEEDNGIYHAMNKGIRHAKGDVIGILNSDDMYAGPEVISDVVKLLKKTGADACYADLDYVDAENGKKIIRRWKSGRFQYGMFLNGWMPPHPTFFVRREVYEKYGVFNTELGTAADYELMLRFLRKHRISVSYLPKTIVKMRAGGQSNVSLKNHLTANLHDRKAWKINGLKPRLWTLWMKPLRKVGQFFVR